MITIGLTGGIGCGKSEVSKLFGKFGIDVIDADLIARQVVEPNTPALAKIVEHFGSEILDSNNELDRAALKRLIFQNQAQKTWLEDLLHPLIRQQIKEQLISCQSPYAILDIPLLLESSHNYKIDRILVVDCPQELQIERTMQRDDLSRESVLQIIRKQASRDERLTRANDIITNDGDLLSLAEQVNALHQQYLKQSTNC